MSQLLRREALELALYSFRYLDGIESTLVLLPPRADGQAATAVFVERGDVRAELNRPLDQTLTAPLAPGVGEIQADEHHQGFDQIAFVAVLFLMFQFPAFLQARLHKHP